MINDFAFDGYVVFCIGSVSNARYVPASTQVDLPTDTDVYFGPAMRSSQGNLKENVLGTKVLWVDADDMQRPQYTLPPTHIVFSGHGWHLYWLLKEPLLDVEEIERLNKLLAEDVPTGDKSCWNANRILRVPGTQNKKNPDYPVTVELKGGFPVQYNKDDFNVLTSLSKATRHKVRTGDSRGYRSRSERDWAVIVDLMANGASDELITKMFLNQPIGEKAKENDEYLVHTLEKAHAAPVTHKQTAQTKAAQAKGLFESREDGYYVATARGWRRVSTFTLDPTLLLDGMDAEDALVCNVAASGFNWTGQTFPRSAFTSLVKMDKSCPIAAWQWTGKDEDVRALLPHLMQQLQEKGLPRVAATSTMGLHKHKDKYFFVGDKHVIGADDVWSDYTGPLAWLASHKEHPKLNLLPITPEAKTMETLRKYIPLLNEPEVILPMLGWYVASMLKPWFEDVVGVRFPILHVIGTRGSGKTTMIQRVFLPLLGQTDPKSYDAGTTRFVTLALLGSSNAIPIAFSEFRYEAVERFLRFILLAYDTGHDPRGRGDQTTVDYPLSAPFSVDGEDLIEDPAARERIVVCQLHPDVIAEGSTAYDAFKVFRRKIPEGFGGYLVQHALRKIVDGSLQQLYEKASLEVFDAFPMRLPDRVRSNHTVVHFGYLLWCDVVGAKPDNPIYLNRSINTVFDTTAGRSRTLSDSMVEDLCNAASQAAQGFRWQPDADGKIVFFQLASVHSWWLASRRRQGRGALERDAIRAQLKESPYIVEPHMVKDTWMYGVDLAQAVEFGLDVPSVIRQRSMVVNF